MRWIGLLALGLLVLALVWLALPPRGTPAPPAAAPGGPPVVVNAAPEEDVETAAVAVRVVDAFDRPLKGCRVLAWRPAEVRNRLDLHTTPDPVAVVRTDGNGEATLDLPAGGTWRIAADRPGSHTAAFGYADSPGDLLLRLPGGVEFRGRVLHGGRPADGAVVTFGAFFLGTTPHRVTDAEGRFALTVPETEGRLEVSYRGRIHHFEVKPFYGEERTFELGGGATIFGTVSDEAGSPVPTAKLLLESERLIQRATVDREGRFRIADLPAGRPKLTVWADGYVPHLPHPVAPPARLRENQEREVKIVLGRGTRVFGRAVCQETQVPLAGAEIRATSEILPVVPETVVTADAVGRFEFRAAAGHRLEVFVRGEGHCRSSRFGTPVVEKVPAGELDLGDVSVPRSIAVLARILDVDGNPRPGIEVLLGTGPWPFDRHRTDAEGRIRSPGLDPEGMVTMGLHDDEWGWVNLFGGGAEEKPVDIRMPAPSTLTGIVTLGGKPVAGATVEAWLDSSEHTSSAVGRGACGRTDAEGRYRLHRLYAATYEVAVRHPSAAPRKEPAVLLTEEGGDTRFDVSLEPKGEDAPPDEPEGTLRIEGIVRTVDGVPVPGVALELRGKRRYVHSDTEGRFVIGKLAAGRNELVTRQSGGEPWVPARIEVEAGDTEVVLVLHRAHILEAAVELPDGRPCPRAEAWLTRGEERIRASVREGKLRFRRVRAGEYDLRIRAPGHLESATPVTVPCTPLVLRLDEGAVIEGRVLGPDGKPVEGANVTAAIEEENVYEQVVTAADGVFRITGLRRSTAYQLWAAARDDAKRSYGAGPVAVKAGGRAVTLTLERLE